MPESRSGLGPLSIEEYLAWENQSPDRHEYVCGRVYSMGGGTVRHGRITSNIASHLFTAAKRMPCQAYVSDLKVRAAVDRVYYPDVVLVCAPHAAESVMIDNPCLIVEVASPSSRRADRGEKLTAYLAMPTLRGYMLAESDRRHVTLYSRGEGETWNRDEFVTAGALVVPCIGSVLSLDGVYEGADPPLRVREDSEDELPGNTEYSDEVEVEL